ncbi:hypothetical protein PQQ64_23095 [Paraburkholderia graminis]|uniref:hypothetical protein n=1 Tax=Paraburkholderia graminis TaxID=60548 RepID=UPI0038BD8459
MIVNPHSYGLPQLRLSCIDRLNPQFHIGHWRSGAVERWSGGAVERWSDSNEPGTTGQFNTLLPFGASTVQRQVLELNRCARRLATNSFRPMPVLDQSF